MPRRASAGRKASLLGERPDGQRHADEVLKVIRALGGRERPVRFSEVYPKLAPPSGSKNPKLWQRISTERALNRLVKGGLIARTEEGYRDLDSPFYALRGFRLDFDDAIRHATRILALRAGPNPKGIELVRKAMPAFAVDMASTVGAWLRAIDTAFQEKARRLGVELGGKDQDVARVAAAVAQALVTGYTMPEYVATGVLGEEEARKATSFTETRMRFPTPGEVDQWKDSIGADDKERFAYLWFRVVEYFAGGEWPPAEDRPTGGARLVNSEKHFLSYSNK